MCYRFAAKEISCRISPTEEAMPTLPQLVHPCATVLLTYMCTCTKGTILREKSRSCMSSAPISKYFIITYMSGLEGDTRCDWVTK